MSGPLWVEHRRTCFAYSAGGHKAELDRLTAGMVFTDRFDVTYRSGRPPDPRARRTWYLIHPRRRPLRTLANVLQALWVVLRERPELVISTGADVAVAAVILGKLLGAEVIFIETGGTLAPSLAGRLAYPFADLFIVPWPEKLRAFPRAILGSGPLL